MCPSSPALAFGSNTQPHRCCQLAAALFSVSQREVQFFMALTVLAPVVLLAAIVFGGGCGKCARARGSRAVYLCRFWLLSVGARGVQRG